MENKMEHEIENGQLIISFYGEIDGYNVAYYRNKLNVLLAINDDDVIFDFKHTTFIDSAGVGLVLGRYQQLSKEGRKLSLRRLSNTAYKVFELSGLRGSCKNKSHVYSLSFLLLYCMYSIMLYKSGNSSFGLSIYTALRPAGALWNIL